MSLVVVKGATLKCSHGGQITISTGDPRLSVDDNAVVTSGMESGLKFPKGLVPPSCNNAIPTSPPTPAPCVTGAATAGQSSKLSVGGLPVLLKVATGPTVNSVSGAAAGTWMVATPGQAKLEAV